MLLTRDGPQLDKGKATVGSRGRAKAHPLADERGIMRLVVTEKQDAAQKIANILGTKAKSDKVFTTPVYRFDVDGEE